MTFLTIVGLAVLYAFGVLTGLCVPKIIAWANVLKTRI